MVIEHVRLEERGIGERSIYGWSIYERLNTGVIGSRVHRIVAQHRS
jgi:hypothetical protein